MIIKPEEAPSRKWKGAISSLPNKRGKDEARLSFRFVEIELLCSQPFPPQLAPPDPGGEEESQAVVVVPCASGYPSDAC